MKCILKIIVITLCTILDINAQFVEYRIDLDHFSDYQFVPENKPKSIVDNDNNIYVVGKKLNSFSDGEYTLGIGKYDLEGNTLWFYEYNSIAFNYDFSAIFNMMINPIDSSFYIGAKNEVLIIDKDGNMKDPIQFRFPNDQSDTDFYIGSSNFMVKEDGTLIYWRYSTFINPNTNQLTGAINFYEFKDDASLNFLKSVELLYESLPIDALGISFTASSTEIDRTKNGFLIRTTFEIGYTDSSPQVLDMNFLFNDDLDLVSNLEGKITYYESMLNYSLTDNNSCNTIHGSNPNNSFWAVWAEQDYVSEPLPGVITINDSIYICEDGISFPLENEIGYNESLVGDIGSYGIPLVFGQEEMIGINILLWDESCNLDSILVTSQQEMQNFSESCKITNHLIIDGENSNITDLSGLAGIKQVFQSITIKNTDIINIELNSDLVFSGDLILHNNQSLVDIVLPESVIELNSLEIIDNILVQDLNGLQHVSNIVEDANISGNMDLESCAISIVCKLLPADKIYFSNNGEGCYDNDNVLSDCSFFDFDMDGYGFYEDCDDMDSSINPGVEDIPNNDIDEDCDGVANIIDQDNDGYNSDEDCDDTDPDINPGAFEIGGNDIDEDCDPSTTEGAIVYIPDYDLKQSIIEYGYDINGDGDIQYSEAAMADSLYARASQSSGNYTGIEAFVNLKYLELEYGRGTLDISNLELLEELDVFSYLDELIMPYSEYMKVVSLNCPNLTELDIPVLDNLKYLKIENTEIQELEIPELNMLEELWILDNPFLDSMEIWNQSGLRKIYCNRNIQLKEIEIHICPNLEYLNLGNNNLSNIDLHEMTSLVHLDLGNNKLFNNNLSNIDLHEMTSLVHLDLGNNNLSIIDLHEMTSLVYLSCHDNSLFNILLPEVSNIAYLNCSNNRLIDLNFDALREIEYLDIGYNNFSNLSSFELSGYEYLESLYLEDVGIEMFFLEDIPSLRTINFIDNPILHANLNDLPSLEYIFCNKELLSLFAKNNCSLQILPPSSQVGDIPGENFLHSDLKFICVDECRIGQITSSLTTNISYINPLTNVDIVSDCSEVDMDDDGYHMSIDCNDLDSLINPGAEEIPNNDIDEDCDGSDLMTSVEDHKISGVSVSPNPFQNSFTIVNESESELSYEIFNAIGQRISQGKLNATAIISLEDTSTGIFFLKFIDSQNRQMTTKLIKI